MNELIDEKSLHELREVFYHTGIADVQYKIFANARVKKMFELISQELEKNSDEFGGNFEKKGNFYGSDELLEDYAGEKVLIVDDATDKAEPLRGLYDSIQKKNSGTITIWTCYASCELDKKFAELLKHVCYRTPHELMGFATQLNHFLLKNHFMDEKDLPNGITQVPTDIYPFLAFFWQTYEIERHEYLKFATFADDFYDTTKNTAFALNLDKDTNTIFESMMSYHLAYGYDEREVRRYLPMAAAYAEHYYMNDDYFLARADANRQKKKTNLDWLKELLK